MIGMLLGLGLRHAMPLLAIAGPHDAVVHAAPDDDDAPRRRSREDTRPRGETLDMGPAATGLAILAFVAALFVRGRRRRS